jgi:hypothetical protein
MLLTDTAIRAAKPGQKKFKLYDRDGLFLLVTPGGSKLWRLRHRVDGKERLMTFGAYPLVSLGHARQLHFEARKTLAAGIDPMGERRKKAEARRKEAKAQQQENSFDAIARKWWEWWSTGKSPRHADTIMRRLEADIFPAFGHKFIDAVTAADVRELMLAIERRDARDVAKRAYENTGQIFRYAVARGIASRNPAADFSPRDILAEAKTENRARVDARELPELLAKMDGYNGDAITRLP